MIPMLRVVSQQHMTGNEALQANVGAEYCHTLERALREGSWPVMRSNRFLGQTDNAAGADDSPTEGFNSAN